MVRWGILERRVNWNSSFSRRFVYLEFLFFLHTFISLKQRAGANSNKEPDPMDRVPHPQTPYMGISEWYLMAKFMLVNKTYPRGKPSLFTSNTEQTLNRHSGNYTSRWRKMKVCDVTSYKYLSHPQTTRRIYQNCRPNDRLKNWVECLAT